MRLNPHYEQKVTTCALWRVLEVLSLAFACALAWLARYSLDPDGVAYIDIARAWIRADWHNALNTYWSPFYSWVVTVGLSIFRPDFRHETYLPHVIVLAGFLCAAWAGSWAVRQWEAAHGPPAHRSLVTCGFFGVLAWAGLGMTGMDFTSADIFVIAVWFLVAGYLVRIRESGNPLRDALILGIVLGAGFLVKNGFLSSIPVVFRNCLFHDRDQGQKTVLSRRCNYSDDCAVCACAVRDARTLRCE